MPSLDTMERLISFDRVTCRIRDTLLLRDVTWTLHRGEHWVILGPNGSGKSTLARTVAGVLPTAGGIRAVHGETRVSLVSFEEQQRLLLQELDRDHQRYYAGAVDDHTTAGDLIDPANYRNQQTGPTHPSGASHSAQPSDALRPGSGSSPIVDTLLQDYPVLTRVWGQSIRSLSAGEMRTVFLARAFAQHPDVLILDEPYDGLDAPARENLQRMISQSIAQGIQIILATHRYEEIPPEITHAITVQDGEILRQGTRHKVLQQDHLDHVYFTHRNNGVVPTGTGLPLEVSATAARAPVPPVSSPAPPLVQFTSTTIWEGSRDLIRDLTWRVHRGEHWVLQGPNGSGKTTLVNLIRGDDPRGYAVRLSLFGVPRGSGESIWELRTRIGTVTPHGQLTYTRNVTVLEAVVSGFYGSVGLFQPPQDTEIEAAHRVLDLLGITAIAEKPILQTSYGQRRLVMIGRAMVHQPELLLLDEPCQGLDPYNRRLVINAVDRICREARSTIIYITHHGDEIPPSISRVLSLTGDGSWLSGQLPATTV